jgi:GNAT superfamily N-acetyltransferase
MRLLRDIQARRAGELVRLFGGEWWSRGRGAEDVARLLAGPSFVFGLEDEAGRLVACTRVLSDGVYKAILFDVIVVPDRRGEGLARLLLDQVLADPRVRDVAHVELYCRREHVPLYARWGFVPLPDDLCLLRRVRPAPPADAGP